MQVRSDACPHLSGASFSPNFLEFWPSNNWSREKLEMLGETSELYQRRNEKMNGVQGVKLLKGSPPGTDDSGTACGLCTERPHPWEALEPSVLPLGFCCTAVLMRPFPGCQKFVGAGLTPWYIPGCTMDTSIHQRHMREIHHTERNVQYIQVYKGHC